MKVFSITHRSLLGHLRFWVATPLAIFATPIFGALLLYFLIGTYYERMFPDYKSKKKWVGMHTSHLMAIVGPVHWERHENPTIIKTDTREIVRRLKPYKATYHCPWSNRWRIFCPVGLEVFSHDDNIITRVRTPFEW